MALTWGGVGNVEFAWKYIYETTGVWPKVTSLVGSQVLVNSNTYSVKWSGSSGPYIIVALRNDPDASYDNLDFKVTVDGSLLFERTGVSYTGSNDVIGQWFDTSGLDHGQIFCRSSYSIEVRRSAGVSGAQYAKASIYGYSLS